MSTKTTKTSVSAKTTKTGGSAGKLWSEKAGWLGCQAGAVAERALSKILFCQVSVGVLRTTTTKKKKNCYEEKWEHRQALIRTSKEGAKAVLQRLRSEKWSVFPLEFV